MTIQRLALIGCGLIGGSVALALRRAGVVRHISGYSLSPSSVTKALELGVIDEACQSAAQAVQQADRVILAVPVAATEAVLRTIEPHLLPDTLITDVGSTKRNVVDAAQNALSSHLLQFVPAHPIAGKEAAGIEHACADLFLGKRAILTPLPNTPKATVDAIREIWASTGCSVHELTPQEHDSTFAAVSHLPHLLAFAYMNGLHQQSQCTDFLAMAGSGFRDFSRIAASDPTIWRDILMANADEMEQQLRQFDIALQSLRSALHNNAPLQLETLIRNASTLRSSWPQS
jgi:prephenate dehydrogenase